MWFVSYPFIGGPMGYGQCFVLRQDTVSNILVHVSYFHGDLHEGPRTKCVFPTVIVITKLPSPKLSLNTHPSHTELHGHFPVEHKWGYSVLLTMVLFGSRSGGCLSHPLRILLSPRVTALL